MLSLHVNQIPRLKNTVTAEIHGWLFLDFSSFGRNKSLCLFSVQDLLNRISDFPSTENKCNKNRNICFSVSGFALSVPKCPALPWMKSHWRCWWISPGLFCIPLDHCTHWVLVRIVLCPGFCPAAPTLSKAFVPPCPCSPAQCLLQSNITPYNLHLPNRPSSLSEACISPSFIFITLALEALNKLCLFEQAFNSRSTEPLSSQPWRGLLCSFHPTRC